MFDHEAAAGGSGKGKLPADVLAALAPLAPFLAAAGMELPREMESAVPQICLGDRVGVLAHSLAQNLRGSGLYKAGPELVTVDEGTGQFQIMTAKRSVSWLDEWVTFWKPSQGEKKFVSINRQKAEEVLASDAFRCKIPVLNGINPVKMPVRRKGGALELLQPGYDAESGIFTLHAGLDYDEAMEPDEARAFLESMLKYFPFRL